MSNFSGWCSSFLTRQLPTPLGRCVDKALNPLFQTCINIRVNSKVNIRLNALGVKGRAGLPPACPYGQGGVGRERKGGHLPLILPLASDVGFCLSRYRRWDTRFCRLCMLCSLSSLYIFFFLALGMSFGFVALHFSFFPFALLQTCNTAEFPMTTGSSQVPDKRTPD
jgi:hypothetical protein